MPELPEVESMRRGLAPLLEGRRIAALEVRKPKLFLPAPGLSAASLEGRRVGEIWRRAKFLVWALSGDLALVFHFKLTGQAIFRAADGSASPPRSPSRPTPPSAWRRAEPPSSRRRCATRVAAPSRTAR